MPIEGSHITATKLAQTSRDLEIASMSIDATRESAGLTDKQWEQAVHYSVINSEGDLPLIVVRGPEIFVRRFMTGFVLGEQRDIELATDGMGHIPKRETTRTRHGDLSQLQMDIPDDIANQKPVGFVGDERIGNYMVSEFDKRTELVRQTIRAAVLNKITLPRLLEVDPEAVANMRRMQSWKMWHII